MGASVRLVGLVALALSACSDGGGPSDLAAPSALVAVEVSRTRIDLTWVDHANDEDGFRIERCAGAGCSAFTEITTVPANTTTYRNTGLAENTSYAYRVRAYKASTTSDYSNVAAAVTPTADFFVHAATGNDSNAGANGAPFKTITKALSVADSGDVVKVRPGRYDAANGETFPLAVPRGVVLVGDEASKGGGATPTAIDGGEQTGNGLIGTAVITAADATVAGFTITDTTAAQNPTGVFLQSARVTIRNNRIVDNGEFGILMDTTATDGVITGNIITGTSMGLGFFGGGSGTRIENNTITNNVYGVVFYQGSGGDLGGGAAGSVGGNVLSCNIENDVWDNVGLTVNAANSHWDHVPPTVTTSGGVADFYGQATSNLITTGASVAPGACT